MMTRAFDVSYDAINIHKLFKATITSRNMKILFADRIAFS